MEKLECVVKTAKNKDSEILWRAIYVDSIKVFENYNINLKDALKYYAPNGLWKEEIILEDDVYSYLDEYFPEHEDFTFLMDYSELKVGNVVYLQNGKNVVKSISKSYRPSGEYEIWIWEEIDNKWFAVKTKQYLQGHDILVFTIENDESNIEYIWEDWNYHQSFLYINYKQHGK